MTQSNADKTNLNNEDEDLLDMPIRPRIDILKERARKMGVSFSPNIGEDTLAKKLAEHDASTQGVISDMVDNGDVDLSKVVLTERELRMSARKAAQKLIRVNVMPNDPMKSQMLGELLFTGNAQIGTIGKLIPFGTPNGYHIPEMLYKIMKEKTFTHFIVKKDAMGNEHVRAVQRPAYNIDVLKPITEKGIKRIAERQQAQAKLEEDFDSEADMED